MGYNTQYTISFFHKETKKSISKDVQNKIATYMHYYNTKKNSEIWFPFEIYTEKDNSYLNEYGILIIPLYCEIARPISEDTKWYEHDKCMIQLSKYFPNIVFSLYGEGEERGDVWQKYYLNGKMKQAEVKIQIEDFEDIEAELI